VIARHLSDPIISGIRRTALSGRRIYNAIRRYIATADGVSMYAALGARQEFTGDFSISAPVVLPDFTATGAYQTVFGGTGLGVGVSPTGQLIGEVSGTSSALTTPVTVTPFDGKINIWTLSLVGTTASFHINDVLQVSWTVPLATNYLETVFCNYLFADFAKASILSVTATDNAAAPVVTDYQISNGSLVYQQAVGYGLGADTVADGGFDLPASFGSPSTAWTFIADIGDIDTTTASKLHITSGVSGSVWNSGAATNDKTKSFVVSFDISDSSVTDGVRLEAYNSAGAFLTSGSFYSADGSYDLLIPANSISQDYVVAFSKSALGTGTLDIDNVTAQEVPKALLYKNFTSATWGETFTRVGTCWARTANTICDA